MERIILSLIVLSILFTSCGRSSKNANEKDTLAAIDSIPINDVDTTAIVLTEKETGKQEAVSEISNVEMLQGKWQSVDDPTNFLVFEGDHRKEISEGMKDWSDEVFALSDKCENSSDKSNNLNREADRYITCKDSDLCWYIVELNTSSLSLSYVARGNTLTYQRAE